MAAKKNTKKAAKKTTKKKTSEKVVDKKTSKEDKIIIKTSYLYGGIIIVGLAVIAVLLITNMSSEQIPQITVLNDESCVTCDTTQVKGALAQMFPNVEIVEVDVSSSKGEELVNTGIPGVPAYFFDKELETHEAFIGLQSEAPEAFVEAGDYYYLNPGIPGAGPSKLYVDVDVEDRSFLGDEDAPLTIIEFSDFECPFCKKWFDETYPELKAKYIDTGKAKLVFLHFPLGFHQNAKPAALAAECAGEQGMFYEMHDKLYENQEELGQTPYSVWANDIGLDLEQFTECMDSEKYMERINNDFETGASVYVGGTPSFIVEDHLIVGAQPIAAFDAILG